MESGERYALYCSIDAIRAREHLDFISNVLAVMSEQGGRDYRIELAKVAYADDDATLAKVLMELSR